MAENNQDRRQEARVTYQSLVNLQFVGARHFKKCETGDISVGGVFVKGVSGVESGEKCEVEFKLIGRSSTLVLEMSAEVIRVGAEGVALQFTQVDQDSFCHLQNIVYYNYKQAEMQAENAEEVEAAVVDETLYLGLTDPRRKALMDEAGDGLIDSMEDDDGLESEISERLSYAREED